jgi:hypothetical protein
MRGASALDERSPLTVFQRPSFDGDSPSDDSNAVGSENENASRGGNSNGDASTPNAKADKGQLTRELKPGLY